MHLFLRGKRAAMGALGHCYGFKMQGKKGTLLFFGKHFFIGFNGAREL